MTTFDFGANIRAFRHRRSWKLRDLSVDCGVSVAMLSEIEQGKKQPTIEAAARIAKSLGVSLSRLIDETTEPAIRILRHDEQRRMIDQASGIERVTLAVGFGQSSAEVVRFVLPPKAATGIFRPHSAKTVEHLTVVTGCIRVEIDRNIYELGELDGISYVADKEHGFSNASDTETACVHLVISRVRDDY